MQAESRLRAGLRGWDGFYEPCSNDWYHLVCLNIGCCTIPDGSISGSSVFPMFSVMCLFSKKLIHITFTGHQWGQEHAWIKSHPPSGNRVFSQTETGNSHVKYIFTATLMMSDRTAVFARKSPLTKQQRLPSLFSKSSFSGLSKFSRLSASVWSNQTARLS